MGYFMEKQVKQHFGYVLSICARNQILNIRRIKFVNTVMLIDLKKNNAELFTGLFWDAIWAISF